VVLVSRADRNRLLRELAELLRARAVDAVFHPAPPWTHGHGWIALQAGQGQVVDAVWYVPAGAHLNGQRLDRPRFVWGSRFQHQADIADDLAATADQIAAHVGELQAGGVR
jgi:hypothetical protein